MGMSAFRERASVGLQRVSGYQRANGGGVGKPAEAGPKNANGDWPPGRTIPTMESVGQQAARSKEKPQG
jgi:hypothetical protein